MKKVGIIGGVGPMAGIDLLGKILNETVANNDQEHIPVVLSSQSHRITDRTEYLMGRQEVNPGIALGQLGSELLQIGCEGLCIPCNTAHHPHIISSFFDTISNHNFAFISLTEQTARFVAKHYPQVKKVGLLATAGTCQTGIYQNAFKPYGIEVIMPPSIGITQVHSAIYDSSYGIKSVSGVVPKAYNILEHYAKWLVGQGVGLVLMACTEIPLAFANQNNVLNIPLIDPTKLLARAVVSFSDIKKLKPYAP